jgi:hypothetical protein
MVHLGSHGNAICNLAEAGEPTFENFVELVAGLPPADNACLSEDLFRYEETGVASSLLEDILRRAACIATADRLLHDLEVRFSTQDAA